MEDANPKRQSRVQDFIIDLNKRIRKEQKKHPAYARRKRKGLIAFALIIVTAFVVDGLAVVFGLLLLGGVSYFSVVTVGSILLWRWETPERKELQSVKERMMQEARAQLTGVNNGQT